jgi:hypothetical protein
MNKLIILSVFIQSSRIAASSICADFEALYLERGGSSAKTLVEQSDTAVITGKDLVHTLSFEPSFRLSLAVERDPYGGMFRGLVSTGWSGHKSVGGGSLSFPFDNSSYAPGYHNATTAKAYYKTNLIVLEGYYTKNLTSLWENYFGFKGFIGLQYFNIPEKTSLNFYTAGATNTYKAQVINNLGLAAVGLMIQIRPYKTLAMEFIGYGGVGGAFITSKTQLEVLNNTFTLRQSKPWGVNACYSFLGTVRAVYRPVSFFEIGLGYEFIYATGLALSYKQMSTGVSRNSDNRISRGAGVWFQGASLRLAFKL